MQKLITLAVIAAVVTGVVVLGRNNTPPVPAPANPLENKPAVPALLMPVKIVLECESHTTISGEKTPDGLIAMRVDKEQHGTPIEYLEIPDGWIDKDKACSANKGKPGLLPAKASYDFEAPRDDTYYVNLRAKWFDGCGNSVWLKIDDSAFCNLEDENGQLSKTNYRWTWHQLYLEGKPQGFALKKGKHTLWMFAREDGPMLDQWLISSEATPPSGDAPVKPQVRDLQLLKTSSL